MRSTIGEISRKLIARFWTPLILIAASLAAFGGPSLLWVYSRHLTHKLMAFRLMEGHWDLVPHVRLTFAHDLQIFNGATFTNWGYGVPLLQLPFHWINERLTGELFHFFPDRAIFFVYLSIGIVFLCH